MSSKDKTLSIAADIFQHDVEGAIRKIPLRDIQPSISQPRKNTRVNIEALAQSLKDNGLLQPIVVTKVDDQYKIIAGERRFLAANLIEWSEIECRILNKNEKDTYRLAVIENLQRENLNPLEESLAYKKLKNKFSYTDAELSNIIGKSRNYISEILSIADIPEYLLKKADQAGIHSKNLLVQLALAVKQGVEKDFIRQYQNNKISSVRSAKEYLKSFKPNIPNMKNKPMIEERNLPPKEEVDDHVLDQDDLWEISFQRIPDEQKINISLKTPALGVSYSSLPEKYLRKLSQRLQKTAQKTFKSEIFKISKKNE